MLFLVVAFMVIGCTASNRQIPAPQQPIKTGINESAISPNELPIDKNETVPSHANSNHATISQPQVNDDEPPLKLKSIGINLGYYDPTTNMAGDVAFTKAKLMFGLVYSDFGFVIKAGDSASGQNKANPQPTFILPIGTKVRSLVDGVVVSIPELYSGDYSIHVATGANSRWRYETEHVINPLVKIGDRVKAGQVIAEVSPHSSEANSGFGLYEIGILKGGNPPQHVCPFAYLDESIRDEVQKKLTALYRSWEEYRGDASLYNESALKMPGCLTLEPING